MTPAEELPQGFHPNVRRDDIEAHSDHPISPSLCGLRGMAVASKAPQQDETSGQTRLPNRHRSEAVRQIRLRSRRRPATVASTAVPADTQPSQVPRPAHRSQSSTVRLGHRALHERLASRAEANAARLVLPESALPGCLTLTDLKRFRVVPTHMGRRRANDPPVASGPVGPTPRERTRACCPQLNGGKTAMQPDELMNRSDDDQFKTWVVASSEEGI